MTQHQTLHDRLMARYGNQKEERPQLRIPVTGRINPETVRRVQELARCAGSGDNAARDQLYFALKPRLYHKVWALKPWPNTPHMTGIWDRDDVRQETWMVFVELLETWNGKGEFVPYLLARFYWRLRDRILRGIGKPQTQFGEIRIPEEMLAEILVAEDGEQPESVAIARKLLEELIRRRMTGASSPGEFEAWVQVINSRQTASLVSPDQIVDDRDVSERVKVA